MIKDANRMLATLLATISTGLVELRLIDREKGARGSKFIPVTDHERAAEVAIERASTCDVYYGAIPRVREGGKAKDVGLAPAIWADVDSQEALDALQAFQLAPSIVVATGSEGHVHVYWLLHHPVEAEVAVRLNRAVAERLGADVAATDAARILRLPGTLNHKVDPPAEVKLEVLEPERRYEVTEFEAVLRVDEGRDSDEDPVGPDASEAVAHVLAKLEGVRPEGGGWKAHCPAHHDTNPSLTIAEGEDGRCLLYCFAGCSTESVVAAMGLAMADLFDDDDADHAGGGHHRKVARVVVGLAHQAGVELFHDPQRESYARFQVDGHLEVWPVRSDDFGAWLRERYYRACDGALGDQALKEAVGLLAAQALYDGPERAVYRRVAGDLQRMFVDLCDEEWRVVEITPDGWRVLARSPVDFIRDPAALPLPLPERGGSLEELRPLLNVRDQEAWVLTYGAILSGWHPVGPYAAVLLLGGEGSAKTTMAKMVIKLTDPVVGALPVSTPPLRDLKVDALNTRLPGFDNVGSLPRKLSDAMCQLTSGGGIRERRFYSNFGLVAAEMRVSVVITARTMVAREADLIDRLILISLPKIDPDQRREESEVLTEFERIKGRAFAGILDAIAGGMKELPSMQPGPLPRLADITKFVTAAEKAMGWSVGAFQRAVMSIQAHSIEESVEAHSYVMGVVDFMTDRATWKGQSTELRAEVAKRRPDLTGSRDWPKAASSATAQLDENVEVLLAHGITYERGREIGGNRTRYIELTNTRFEGDAGRDGTRPRRWSDGPGPPL